MYNVFIAKEHLTVIQQLMIRLNENIVDYVKELINHKHLISLLEIGPGKGYFYQACMNKTGIDYYALDRNSNILKRLGIPDEKIFQSELPDVTPLAIHSFDVVYSAFVFEHLENGARLFNTIMALKKQIKPGGFLIIQVPNAKKLGIEFWNNDYTHSFPTTKRNIYQVLSDCGIHKIQIHDVSGLMTYKNFWRNKFPYWALRLVMSFYNYQLYYSLFGWMIKSSPVYDLDNVFYKAFGLLKTNHLFIVAKVD